MGKGTQKPLNTGRIFVDGVIGGNHFTERAQKNKAAIAYGVLNPNMFT